MQTAACYKQEKKTKLKLEFEKKKGNQIIKIVSEINKEL